MSLSGNREEEIRVSGDDNGNSSAVAAARNRRDPTMPTMFRYMECLKNHAAALGGNARDGCGEFLPAGEDGTIEALRCAACNCHRNFHRKIHLQHQAMGEELTPLRAIQAEEGGAAGGDHRPAGKRKRFRTKFTQEQKEKMQEFAERSGWRIQKLGESEVKRFCQEIGVKRKVLKVWMHNNKYHNCTLPAANKTEPAAATAATTAAAAADTMTININAAATADDES
ncbi:zinc-finger homeodomain protein 10-like [Andrographis paniculata]|uniref:zinc-finger homeodomain protein 10-like n=1 Tax=Andrographis paniculata TaxID=175694 RepID=UPI0021E83ADB|nr:zinc-finger homeodomain protein 10-like [Andrographis paniculata]